MSPKRSTFLSIRGDDRSLRPPGDRLYPLVPLAFRELVHSGGALDQIAKRHNAQPGQIALAWLLKRSSTMLPIPGTSSLQHLEENIAGTMIKLSQEEFNAIDRASK